MAWDSLYLDKYAWNVMARVKQDLPSLYKHHTRFPYYKEPRECSAHFVIERSMPEHPVRLNWCGHAVCAWCFKDLGPYEEK